MKPALIGLMLMPLIALATFAGAGVAEQLPGGEDIGAMVREGGSIGTLIIIMLFGLAVLRSGVKAMKSWEHAKADEAKMVSDQAKIAQSWAEIAKYTPAILRILERIIERTPPQRQPESIEQ